MAGLDGLLVAMGGMGRTPTRGQVDVVLNGIFFSPDTLGKRAKNVVISIANISDNNDMHSGKKAHDLTPPPPPRPTDVLL